MKYRIVEKDEGFVIQTKLLFIWKDFSYCPLYQSPFFYCGGWKFGPSRIDCWKSKEEAVRQLNFMSQYPIKYKGHTIYATNRYYNPTYYESKSIFDISDGAVKFASDDLGDLYKKIDRFEEERLKRKRSNIIINIFDEHGNDI